MEITFDPEKNKLNEAKHGLSFWIIEEWDWSNCKVEKDFRHHEPRWRAFGLVDGRLLVMVFTVREEGTIVRVISLRKANRREIKRYANT